MKIISVVGARPNFMKIAPFIRSIKRYNSVNNQNIKHLLVHTGQHYDHQMSQKFFDDLDIPPADIHLGVGSGTHAEQVGNTMIAFEKVLNKENPDWVVVVGDVNATLACAVTAKKEQFRCCHIEAGLRSGDLTMPEEINRLVTDRLSDLLLTPDDLSVGNLLLEGVKREKIGLVGNIMIDTVEEQREKSAALNIDSIIESNLLPETKDIPRITEGNFTLLTLHRPSNVDHREVITPLVEFLTGEAAGLPLIWPIHPRTKKKLQEFELWEKVTRTTGMVLLRPVGYHEMLRLNMGSRLLLTDSGGLQGESSVLGTPCIVLRWNTEWTVTLAEQGGTCQLAGNDVNRIRQAYEKAIQTPRKPSVPDYWDGRTAERCLEAILKASI